MPTWASAVKFPGGAGTGELFPGGLGGGDRALLGASGGCGGGGDILGGGDGGSGGAGDGGGLGGSAGGTQPDHELTQNSAARIVAMSVCDVYLR